MRQRVRASFEKKMDTPQAWTLVVGFMKRLPKALKCEEEESEVMRLFNVQEGASFRGKETPKRRAQQPASGRG